MVVIHSVAAVIAISKVCVVRNAPEWGFCLGCGDEESFQGVAKSAGSWWLGVHTKERLWTV